MTLPRRRWVVLGLALAAAGGVGAYLAMRADAPAPPTVEVPVDATELAAAVAEARRSVELRLRLAEALLALGRTDDAEAEFRQLARAEPGHPRANLGLARAALARGDLAGCEKHLAAAANDPRSRQAAATVLVELQYQ